MFAHINTDKTVHPPKVSVTVQILLGAGGKQEAIIAYNTAAIAVVATVSKPQNTHFLGRAASIPDGGFIDYVAACFIQAYYCANPFK